MIKRCFSQNIPNILPKDYELYKYKYNLIYDTKNNLQKIKLQMCRHI